MKSVKDRRSKDLAKIHIAKKELGLNDETYRAMLFNITGVSSAVELDQKGRDKILRHLKNRGFISHHTSAKASGMHIPAAPERASMLAKIGAILADLQKSWPYADGIAKRSFGVEKVRWLNPEQLMKVMQMLICYQKKVHEGEGQNEV